EKLGIVVLTNSEADLMAALSYRLLDDFLNAPKARTDWVSAFAQAAEFDRAQADSVLLATRAGRDSLSPASLPLELSAGRYRAALYGDGTVALESGRLVLRFSHSRAFVGDL